MASRYIKHSMNMLRVNYNSSVIKNTTHFNGVFLRRSAEMEKCFLCQELFSPQEYQDHVELCLKKKDSRTNEVTVI